METNTTNYTALKLLVTASKVLINEKQWRVRLASTETHESQTQTKAKRKKERETGSAPPLRLSTGKCLQGRRGQLLLGQNSCFNTHAAYSFTRWRLPYMRRKVVLTNAPASQLTKSKARQRRRAADVKARLTAVAASMSAEQTLSVPCSVESAAPLQFRTSRKTARRQEQDSDRRSGGWHGACCPH